MPGLNKGFRCRHIVSLLSFKNVAWTGAGAESNLAISGKELLGSKRSPLSRPRCGKAHVRQRPLQPRLDLSYFSATLTLALSALPKFTDTSQAVAATS